jgi:hypothetical protein
MMTKVFKGVVTCGDAYRVYDGEQNGSVWIGGVDVLDRLDCLNTQKVIVGWMDQAFDGELFVSTGWGYSEYTPMDADEMRVGPHNLIAMLSEQEGKEVTLVISTEPINLLDLPEPELP